MICKICGCENSKMIYNGLIRNGGLGKYTKSNVPVFQCDNCKVIWHENQLQDMQQYYESQEYREMLEGGSEEERFYTLHDKESLDKLVYTGTDIYRNKVVADIGCGCGAFLDFLKGVAQTVIAIEPSATYRKIMDLKGFRTYAYSKDAKRDWTGKVDVITSFDVIEHVEEPQEFIRDAFDLLSENGKAIIGTPTDAPIMRKLLGEVYEKKLLFSTQHLWIFSEENLKLLADKVGFQKIEIKYFQRYGLGNLLGWVKEKEPRSEINDIFITSTMNNVWKSECSDNKLADYIVMYLYKL